MVEDSESRGEHLERMKAIHKVPAPKFKRHDPQLGRIWSEAALLEEMEHAAELLQSEEDFGRSGTRHALHACYSFLRARGLSGQGLKPLIDLMAALESVASGSLPELFDPKLKPGRMPKRKWSRSHAARETKLHAAACMDALMKLELSKDEAAARVARHTHGWPRISKGLITPNTVTNWRDELRQQSSDNRDRKQLELRSKSKSYLDKLRVYGGGPEFIRLGKRKILYRKCDLDLWAGQRRFGSTSEYQGDRIPIRDQFECIFNNKKLYITRTHVNSCD